MFIFGIIGAALALVIGLVLVILHLIFGGIAANA